MSKKSHNEELRKWREAESLKKAELETKKRKKKVLLTLFVSVFAVLALSTAIFADYLVSSGYFMRRTISLESENFKVDNCMMSYFLHTTMQNYASRNAQNLEKLGLDPSEDLKAQPCYYSDGSWFDYFLSLTKQSVKELVLYAEEGLKNGAEFDETSYNDRYEDIIASIKDSAKEEGYSKNQYIELLYGKGVREKDIKNCVRLIHLSSDAYDSLYKESSFTDEEIDKYFSENMGDYALLDYISYTFESTLGNNATDAEMNDMHAKNEASAEALAKTKTPDEFIAFVKKYSPEATYEKLLSQGVSKSSANTIEEEVYFDKKASLHETVIYSEDDLSYTVYMLVKPMYAIDYITKDVRHILITSSSFDSDSEAKSKAEEILEEFNKNKTADNFVSLVEKYSEDTASVANGGLYKDIELGEMVEPFEEWCYDEIRTAGDTGIVKTDYGYHIMYFVGDGSVYYRKTVLNDMKTDAANKVFSALEEKHTTRFIEENFSGISG
jgi:parvulin-like peptidyl-prolyl isomerase